MDGTYGNVFPTNRSMSPALGNPSSANEKYKINVSRQKTRKWANFKPQNYDGDDWGDDYEDEPEPPPLSKPQGPRSPTAALASSGVQQHQRAATMPVTPQHPASVPDTIGSLGSLGSLPSQAQPRKNSTDTTRPAGAPWLPRTAGPGEAPKPWAEPRSSSPSHANSLPSPSSPTRPFVRPADIYRKLEEEKRRSLEFNTSPAENPTEKEQQLSKRLPQETVPKPQAITDIGANVGSNLDRGGLPRPTLASVTERKSEYGIESLLDSYGLDEHNVEPSLGALQPSFVAATIQAQPVGPTQQGPSHTLGEGPRRFSTSPQLPLVTRMSGFGEDLFSPSSFFDDVKLQPPINESTPTPAPINVMAVSSPSQVGNGSAAPMSRPASPLRTGDQAQALIEGGNVDFIPSPDAQPDVDAQGPQPVSSRDTDSTSKALSAQDSKYVRSSAPSKEAEASVGLQGDLNAARLSLDPPTQTQPAADPPREAASSEQTEEKVIVRPLLPGGWVSENPVTPSDSLIPTRIEAIPATTGSSEESKVAPPNNFIPVKAGSSRQSSPDRVESVKEINLAADGNAALSTSRSVSPHIVPPLRILSPVSNAAPAMTPSSKPQNGDGSPENVEPATPIPNTATSQNSEITPTAPLNPRRDRQDLNTNVKPVLSTPSYGTGSAIEAETSSPLKESDVLSEEIMKSLSPIQSSESFVPIHGDATAAYHTAVELARESSYLGDVYDDYWTATDEKTEPKLFAAVVSKSSDEARSAQFPTADSMEAPKQMPATLTLDTLAGESTASASAKQASSVASSSTADRRRFSWEAGFSDPASVDIKPVDPNSLASGKPKPASLTVASLPVSPGAGHRSLGPEVKVDSSTPVSSTPAAGLVSCQVSQASSLIPRSTAGAPAEPPSPTSGLSEKEVARSSPPLGGKGLTFTDEKIAVEKSQIQENSASPVPSHEQQVDPAEIPQKKQPQVSHPPLQQQLRKDSINVLPFRQIMEVGSPAERIKQFNESRSQFAAMDTGLDEWLMAMLSSHPEHRSANVAGLEGQQGLHSPTGQAPRLPKHGGPGPHGIPANIPMPPPQQHGTGAFGHLHSTNQVGTKGKEFFMAAGKAGKGLFSKGRNKLRGTGDRVSPNS